MTSGNHTETVYFDEIFNLMKSEKIVEAIEYVNQGKLKAIDSCDKDGTTVLQYAAFRGYIDLCRLLISKGANVNANSHDQGYTALMFAAISNHSNVVSLLLDHGANTERTNSIGRTAVQMAAFVNSNEAVDVIKGFIPKSGLEYFTNITGISETESKLPKGECCDELYKLLTQSVNYSPVRIIKAVKSAPVLFANVNRVVKTLDAYITKAIKEDESGVPNDVLGYKLHYYKFMFEYIISQKKLLDEKKTEEDSLKLQEKMYEICIKRLLTEELVETKGEENKPFTHMYRVFEEKFIRESIRKFPYPESPLIQQLVTVLSKTPVGSEPSALKAITDCLNGQRMNASTREKWCSTCYEEREDLKRCTHCRKVAYCDQFCQRLHWPIHKKEGLTESN